jgi:hypothetical protein
LIEIFRETLELQPEGVGFVFNRGMPLMLWEDAFCARFKQMHNADAKSVEDDDPRIHATRAAIMTDFMLEVRALLDETAAKQGRKERYKISLGTFAKEADNQKWGMTTWARRSFLKHASLASFSLCIPNILPPGLAANVRLAKLAAARRRPKACQQRRFSIFSTRWSVKSSSCTAS